MTVKTLVSKPAPLALSSARAIYTLKQTTTKINVQIGLIHCREEMQPRLGATPYAIFCLLPLPNIGAEVGGPRVNDLAPDTWSSSMNNDHGITARMRHIVGICVVIACI
jgi:hypothetical protein